MKKLHTLFLACIILVSFCAGAVASGNLEEIKAFLNYGITVKLDGETQTMYDEQGTQVYPITYNGTTYVPIRAVSNMLGIRVAWDGENNTVLLGESDPVIDAPLNEIARGILKDQTYENKFAGIGMTLPDGWTFATDEQIKEVLSISAGTENVAELTTFCDVLAFENALGSNINLVFEKKSAAIAALDFEAVYAATIDTLKTSLAEVYNNVKVTKATITIAGQEYNGYEIEGNYNGTPICQKGFLIDLGTHVATVTVTTTSADNTSEALDYFYVVK